MIYNKNHDQNFLTGALPPELDLPDDEDPEEEEPEEFDEEDLPEYSELPPLFEPELLLPELKIVRNTLPAPELRLLLLLLLLVPEVLLPLVYPELPFVLVGVLPL